MNVMVIGGGGREHAVIRKIRENPNVENIYALPGNGGIAEDAECIDIGAEDLAAIRDFAVSHPIDFAVVTPDDPLCMGLVDILENEGIPCFGPNKDAAIIEGSKAFAKDLMKKYGIPTAEYAVFDDMDKALDYIKDCTIPVVVKADGLAKGKGVLICHTREDAESAVRSIMEGHKFGDSGEKIVIEEFLEGPEVSVLSFTDGNILIPMVSSMDHKRALDGDRGLNTGGMGAVAPNPYYTEDIAKICEEEIFLPTMIAMNKEGRSFKGCLYFGLIITKDGPKVIEYNCRFGDPEAQTVLPLLKTDLLNIMINVSDGKLFEDDVRFADEYSCCVVMASKGYPSNYEKGKPLSLPENEDYIFVAGAKSEDNGSLVTSGGRVLNVIANGGSLKEAIDKAYERVKLVKFPNGFYRKDIGQKALKANI